MAKIIPERDGKMSTSQFDNFIPPRYQGKKESIDQYLIYFSDLIEANEWDDKRSAAIFKAMLPVGSDEWREPIQRNSLVDDFYNISRKKSQSLDDLAAKISELTDQLYPSMPKDNKALIERDRFLTSLNPELRIAIVTTQSNLKTLTDVKNMANYFAKFL
ncbi:hypothetical protein BLOT_007375 [Blomia tropicalis]|nr:hypothetical protein BLOT_007375 [Blomia tropicalis]